MTKVSREDFCLDKDKRCPEAYIVMLYGYIDKFFVELRVWCDFYLHDYLLTDTGNSKILPDLFSPLPAWLQASQAVQFLGTTGSPDCSCFLCVPTTNSPKALQEYCWKLHCVPCPMPFTIRLLILYLSQWIISAQITRRL